MDKATLTADFDKNGITFDNVVDAIAKLPSEDESGLFLIISPSQKAALRKNLGEKNLNIQKDLLNWLYLAQVAAFQ